MGLQYVVVVVVVIHLSEAQIFHLGEMGASLGSCIGQSLFSGNLCTQFTTQLLHISIRQIKAFSY